MKINKINLLLLSILIVFLGSCSPTEENLPDLKYNQEEINKIVDEHLDLTMSVFQDSIDAEKGFMGWKNIRDYFGLGDEGFKDRTLRIWDKTYDNEGLERKIETILSNDKSINIELSKSDEHILQYIHKISLSLIVLIAEGFFELLLDIFFGYTFAAIAVFAYAFYQFTYGGWIRMSKGRHAMINNIATRSARYATYFAVLLSICLGVYNGDYSDKALKNKIKNDIKQDINIQIQNNLK